MAASVVRDIMTKEIVTIDENKTALDAARIMSDRAISSVFVTKDDTPIGIVTERDFVKKICALERTISSVKITEIMSGVLTTAGPETPIEVAVQRMINHKIRRLPIMDNGRIVGIITVTDLAKHLRTTLLLEGAIHESEGFDNVVAALSHDK